MNITIISGAGMSAESGISTFRDSGGLWEQYKIEDVATPEAWLLNPNLVLEFYNKRRAQLAQVSPNKGHLALAEAEQNHHIQIITQNVDNLHERAGSKNVLHLHGELTKVRSTKYPELIYNIGYKNITNKDKCEKGYPLRPHIVWFGEEVPLIEKAAKLIEKCDVLIVVGTSLNVYPAAGLLDYTPPNTPIYLIDPNPVSVYNSKVVHLKLKATEGIPEAIKIIVE